MSPRPPLPRKVGMTPPAPMWAPPLGNLHGCFRSKTENNWLNNAESFPLLPSINTISITRNVIDPASHDADSAQMSTVILNDKISESSTSQGPQGQRLLNSSDNAPNYVDAVKSIPRDSDEDGTESFQVVTNKKRRSKFVVGSRQCCVRYLLSVFTDCCYVIFWCWQSLSYI